MRFSVVASVLGVILACSTLVGAPWTAHGPKRSIHTMIIAGNYKSSRLLADLIQNESRQPYILLPDPRTGDSRIFFCPPKSASREVPESRFNEFIRFANPKRIVILGDSRFVPERFEKMLDGSIPVVRITANDWNRIAEELTFMLNLSHLDDNYRRLRETMLNDAKIYRAISRPAPAQPEVKETEEKSAAAPEAAPEKPAADVPAAL